MIWIACDDTHKVSERFRSFDARILLLLSWWCVVAKLSNSSGSETGFFQFSSRDRGERDQIMALSRWWRHNKNKRFPSRDVRASRKTLSISPRFVSREEWGREGEVMDRMKVLVEEAKENFCSTKIFKFRILFKVVVQKLTWLRFSSMTERL